MPEFTLSISKQRDEIVMSFVRFEILQLEVEMLQRSYDQEILLKLGGTQMKQHRNNEEIFMINTPMSTGKDEYLIIVQYVNVSVFLYFTKIKIRKYYMIIISFFIVIGE